jgi:hypothetical protein
MDPAELMGMFPATLASLADQPHDGVSRPGKCGTLPGTEAGEDNRDHT